MKEVFVERFYIIGLAVRTTVQDGKAPTDVGNLWTRFFTENIIESIPNRIGHSIYCAYTEYEDDHTKPFTAILGCKVSTLQDIPKGLTGKVIDGANYNLVTAKGKIGDGVVFLEWMNVWHSKWPRAYTTDFEVYGEKAKDTDNAEVDIFVSLK